MNVNDAGSCKFSTKRKHVFERGGEEEEYHLMIITT